MFLALLLIGALFVFLALAGVVVFGQNRVAAVAMLVLSCVALPLAVLAVSEVIHRPGAGSAYLALGFITSTLMASLLQLARPKLKQRQKTVTSLVTGAILVTALAMRHNPWAAYGVCFTEDTPGFSGSFRSFTPVDCTDSSRALGEPVGATYATMRFADLDGDHIDELTVTQSTLSCPGAGWCVEHPSPRSFKITREPVLRVVPFR